MDAAFRIKGVVAQMKKYLVAVLLLFPAFVLFAQSRDDVTVYVPPVSGGNAEEQMFFTENFKMELTGANYVVVENQDDSDYILALSITRDKYEEGGGVQTDNLLTVSLLASSDGRELLQFSWGYTDLEEMNEWNLHLIYQAMANVPLTKLTSVPDTNHWRNKWIYVRASFDYPITFYADADPNAIYGDGETASGVPDYDVLEHKVLPYPGFTAGIEFQFLSWMSIEGNFQLTFSDPFSLSLIPAIGVELKFPLKPSKHFMLEPYGIAVFPTTTATETLEFPTLGVGGGIQFGVKGGPIGALFIDVNYVHYLEDVVTKNTNADRPHPSTISWQRFSIGLGIGYKIGFFNRNKDNAAP
jgi:hypothetical protein